MSGPDASPPDAARAATNPADASCPDPSHPGHPGHPGQAAPARAPDRPTVKALHGFRRPGLWLGLWMLMIGAVIAGSLLPARDLPPVPFDGFDKLEHFFGYAVLSGYAAMLFARLRAQALAAAGLFALGIGLEVAQAMLTASRQADIADALINGIGVLAGLAITATPMARLLLRLDARLR